MSGARRGIPFVVAAPSGTGKTTVCQLVVKGDAGVEFSVSHTTRPRREGERDGVDYHFVERAGFERLVADGAFLEWAEYNDNLYGTSWASIDGALARGRDVLLEIEVQGAAQVRERRADARLIFLVPPSKEVLAQRLRERGTDDEAQVARRLAAAEGEFEAGRSFDYVVVNDELARCVADVAAIVRGERNGEGKRLRARFDPGVCLERFLRGARS